MLKQEEIEELKQLGYKYTIDETANRPFIGIPHQNRFTRKFKSTGRPVRFFEFESKNITIFEVFEKTSL